MIVIIISLRKNGNDSKADPEDTQTFAILASKQKSQQPHANLGYPKSQQVHVQICSSPRSCQ